MQPEAKPRILPELRQELRLESGAPGPSGQSTWLIVDPIQQRVTILEWVDGFYEEQVYAGDSKIESVILANLDLTVDRVLQAR